MVEMRCAKKRKTTKTYQLNQSINNRTVYGFILCSWPLHMSHATGSARFQVSRIVRQNNQLRTRLGVFSKCQCVECVHFGKWKKCPILYSYAKTKAVACVFFFCCFLFLNLHVRKCLSCDKSMPTTFSCPIVSSTERRMFCCVVNLLQCD